MQYRRVAPMRLSPNTFALIEPWTDESASAPTTPSAAASVAVAIPT